MKPTSIQVVFTVLSMSSMLLAPSVFAHNGVDDGHTHPAANEAIVTFDMPSVRTGTIADGEGNVFTGPLVNGSQIEGDVDATYQDGRNYKGDFYGWQPNGTGVMTYADKITFSGTFKDGFPVEGTLSWPDQVSYVNGTFQFGVPLLMGFDQVKGKIRKQMMINGKTVYAVWDGHFTGDEMSKGTIRFPDGNQFTGVVKPNSGHTLSDGFDYYHPHGYGSYRTKNGDVFYGLWAYDESTGKITASGRIKTKTGKIKAAKWTNGQLMVSKK